MRHRYLVMAAMMTAAATLICGSVQAEVTSLRLSVDTPPGSATTQLLSTFRDELQKGFGDSVEVEYFDTAQLGDEIVHLEQVRTGQMDVVPLGSEIGQFVPEFAIFDMPFLFTDRDTLAEVLDGEIGQELDQKFQENANIKVLGFGEIGFRVIYNSKQPVITPADLEGMKLRTPGSKARIMTFQMLGGSPVSMPLGELYLGLQSGVVDGSEGPLSTYNASSFYEVTKYVTISRHVYTPSVFAMNLGTWNELSDEQRAIVTAAARAAIQANREFGEASDAALVDEIKEKTKGAVQFDEPDLVAFKEASKPIWEELSKIVGEDFSRRVIDMVGQQ